MHVGHILHHACNIPIYMFEKEKDEAELIHSHLCRSLQQLRYVVFCYVSYVWIKNTRLCNNRVDRWFVNVSLFQVFVQVSMSHVKIINK